MNAAELGQMTRIAETMYLREEQKIRDVLQREARLRGALAQLDAHERGADAAQSSASAMRMLGADCLWRSWLGRKRGELNRELAQVMAIKLQRIDALRTALGRKEALAKMQASEMRIRKKDRATAEFNRMLDQI